MQEAERTLFFLCGMVRLQGRWQAGLVQGPLLARRAAVAWVYFSAQPSLDRDFSLDCTPTTATDKVRSRFVIPSPASLCQIPRCVLPLLDQHFRLAFMPRVGLSIPPPSWTPGWPVLKPFTLNIHGLIPMPSLLQVLRGQPGLLGKRSLVPVIRPATSCTQALSAQPTELPLEEGWFGVTAQGCSASHEERADRRALPPPRAGSEGTQHLTEFSAQLAEGIYGCCAQALAFLASSAPEACISLLHEPTFIIWM